MLLFDFSLMNPNILFPLLQTYKNPLPLSLLGPSPKHPFSVLHSSSPMVRGKCMFLWRTQIWPCPKNPFFEPCKLVDLPSFPLLYRDHYPIDSELYVLPGTAFCLASTKFPSSNLAHLAFLSYIFFCLCFSFSSISHTLQYVHLRQFF